ncbi:PTS sugar transporter subunit IIC [Lactimicrobium massiliense]|uniref:PTS sugar transporter subunit IIC n=1 Tax=Lactimicrobium massiliense TaxID=2161814 RepID=UPI000D55C8C0|nr:PTS transporter subunit EIIC [Lactimicrobium massiliense]
MEKKANFTDKLTVLSDKISGNLYLQSISQGVMMMLPVIIIGSFASLFSGLPVGFWQNFIQSTGIASALAMVINGTTNMLGVYFTYGIARTFAEKQGMNSKLAGIFAIAVYFILLPAYAAEGIGSYLAFDYTGTKGMIVGIILAILSVKVLKLVTERNITIKMPNGTPEYVSRSFAALIPGFILIVLAIVLRMIFAATPFGSIFDCLYGILQIPLQALLGGSVISNVIIQILTQVCWGLGIHPGFLSSITAPVLFSLDGANQAAYAAGQPIPNTIGMAMSYSSTIACFYPAIAVCVLLFAKSRELKTVGKVAIAPAIFGISEPMIFGLPIMLNPVMIIPWVICPVVNFVLAYAACSLGIVAKYAGVVVFNFPMIATGLLNGSFSLVILEIVLFAIDVVIFLPFVKALDRKKLETEKAE